MKILYLITTKEGGAWKYVQDLSNNLSKEFKVVIPDTYLKRNIGLHDITALWHLIRLIKKGKPDILHLNSAKAGFLGSIAGRICKVPKIIYSTHGGGAFSEDLPLWKKWFYRECERRTAKYKDYFIVFTETSKEHFIKHKIIPKKGIVVIMNGI